MPNENSQIAVTAILRELEIDPNFSSKEDRLSIQKSIYLAQVAGVKLSYWFNWYLNGPYCSALADDYYEAKKDIEKFEGYKVSPEVERKLSRVKELIARRPASAKLEEWLEALASIDYIIRVQKFEESMAVSICETKKPHLKPIIRNAIECLKEFGLVR